MGKEKTRGNVEEAPSHTYVTSTKESYHEPTESYIIVEEYTEEESDKDHKFVAKVNEKLIKKIEEKKWIFDSIFDVWLQVLEIKKKILYKLWKKKQGKKKKESGNTHYKYYIPYYSSTYKPYVKDHYHVKPTVSYTHHTTTTTYKPRRKEKDHFKVPPISFRSEQIKKTGKPLNHYQSSIGDESE